MLRVHELEAGYASVPVLKRVSLDVQRGEIVTVVGANGAGKSTLLKAIAGLIRPRAGRVVFDGKVVSGREAHVISRLGLCLVPEGRQLFGSLSVLDNLMLTAQFARQPRPAKAEVENDIEHVFSLFPRLKERRAQRAATLSGGEGQMLALGRALMARPRLLMLDEPSLGLAPKVVQEIFDVIRRLREQIPVLLVEQNANLALEIADRGIVLETGRVVLSGRADELLGDQRVREHYLGSTRWRRYA